MTKKAQPDLLDVVHTPTTEEDALLTPVAADLKLRMDRVLMEYPFFSIQKQRVTTKTVFKMGDTQITITPSADGQATYWDLDILRYAISELNRQMDEGEKPSQTIVFVAHRFLKMSGRTTTGAGYTSLLDALRRLHGTKIETNIQAGGKFDVEGFNWIEKYRLLGERDSDGSVKRLQGISIKLSDWVFDAIVQDRRVLSYSPEYFALSSGLERRLYDIARKFCGRSPHWPVGLANLHQRVGSTAPLRRFRLELAKIAEADSLPDYRIEIVDARAAKAVKDGAKPTRAPLDRLKVIIRRKSPVAAFEPAPGDDTITIPYAVVSETPETKAFPDSGTIRYSDFAQLARDKLPRPTPDIDMVAGRFRAWCSEKGVALDSKSIAKTFGDFCAKWRMDRS